jgi:hypothetical protein
MLPIYVVRTHWIIYHPNQIRVGLRKAGFELINKTQIINRCGWQRLATFSKSSVRRGTFDVNGTAEPGAMEKVENVMISAYPFTEITIILCFLVAPIAGFIGLIFAARGNIQKQKRRAEPQPRKCLETRFKDWKYKQTDPEKLAFHPPSLGNCTFLHALPTELHLDILEAIPYPDLKMMRATCRFYYSLVPKNRLGTMRQRWEDVIKSEEKEQRICRKQLPCFTCLDIKPLNEFAWIEQLKQHPRSRYSGGLGYSNVDRKCIDCMVNDGKGKNGLPPFEIAKDKFLHVCGCCGVRSDVPDENAGFKMKGGGNWCAQCYEKNGKILAYAFAIRVPQFLIAFTIFCVLFTGRNMSSLVTTMSLNRRTGGLPSHLSAWASLILLVRTLWLPFCLQSV